MRRYTSFTALATLALLLSPVRRVEAQALSVLPVNLSLLSGQRATTLTVTNRGNAETAIQVRAYLWNQLDGKDELAASDQVVASPPLATIGPGATQVIRLILRGDAKAREATYRILLDQIPPPAQPGVVSVVLRMSIPVFAQPAARAVPRLRFRVEESLGQLYLVGINDGQRHETLRNIVLSTRDGRMLKPVGGASPYILAGVTRRWPLATPEDAKPLEGRSLRFSAQTDAGPLEEQVEILAVP